MELKNRDDWEKECQENKYSLMDQNSSECRFCNIKNQEIAPYIIWKWKHFYICHNKYPILGLDNHLMAIPYKHHLNTADISPEEWSDFAEVEKFMKDFYGDTNYFSFIRQSKTGRSIAHIHYHYLPGIMYYEALHDMLEKQGF